MRWLAITLLAGSGAACSDEISPVPMATVLAITAQPSGQARSGEVFSSQPVVQLRDETGKDVPQPDLPVSTVIESGAGALGGTHTVRTDISGRAAFTDLAITGIAGSHRLTFSSGSLIPATSQTIALGPGLPARLLMAREPSSVAQSDLLFDVQPVIQLRDGAGNIVPEGNVVIEARVAAGTGTLGGSTTVTTGPDGQAAFADLFISGLGAHSLSFESGLLLGVNSREIDVHEPPSISLSELTLAFAAMQGGADPPDQSVTISNGGAGVLNGLAVGIIGYSGGASGWILASLSGTTASPSVTLDVQVALGSLAAGTYTATIPVMSPVAINSPRTLTVTLVVGAPPLLSLSASQLTFNAVQGGPHPADQTVTIANGGGGVLSGISAGSVVFGPDASGWAGVTMSGTTAAPTVTMTVRASSEPLSGGTYMATIPIVSTNAANSPLAVTVTLVVTAPLNATYRLSGIDLGVHADGSALGSSVSEDTVLALLQRLRPYTRSVRSYSMRNGEENIPKHGHRLGFSVACGTFLDGSSNDAVEISRLKTAVVRGECDLAIVDNETFERMGNVIPEHILLDHIADVQSIAGAVPVTTAQTYSDYLTHPALFQAVDVFFVNIFPFWEGAPIEIAMAPLHQGFQFIRHKADSVGKGVIVSEAGHPSGGNSVVRQPYGPPGSVPSPENAAFHFLSFVSWARAQGVAYYYFEAFDEAAKAGNGGLPQEAHWGLWTGAGSLKPGMQTVVDGNTLPPVGNPGNPPTLEFTSVPPRGSLSDLIVTGRVRNVRPAEYEVALYIRVNGFWITKPFLAAPAVAILADGSWRCQYVTGGTDQDATEMRAFLVPATYRPPLLEHGTTTQLPALLSAFVSVGVVRP